MPLGDPAYVTAASDWMRPGTSSKWSKVARLKRCEEVRIVGRSSGWRNVAGLGKQGHVYYKYVSTTKPAGCSQRGIFRSRIFS